MPDVKETNLAFPTSLVLFIQDYLPVELANLGDCLSG